MVKNRIVVVGDGWAALGAVGFLVTSGIEALEVTWISGTGTRILAPVSSLEWGAGADLWKQLSLKLNLEWGESRDGIFVREFRNKSFRLPAWSQAETLDEKTEVKNESLWGPERSWVGGYEAQLQVTFGELEEQIRQQVAAIQAASPLSLKKIEQNPVTGFQVDAGKVRAVILGSGERIECDEVIFADRWGVIPSLDGVPKPVSFLRNRESMGILQASLSHDPALSSGVRESFFATLPGEEKKHVWGYISSDGKKSTWTLGLSPEEGEDNHAIAKKLRKMKSILEKMFSGTAVVPAEAGAFERTIADEQVRFEEDSIFGTGKPLVEPCSLKGLEGVFFLTDGYGPSFSIQQVASYLSTHGILTRTNTEAENVNSQVLSAMF